MEFKKAEPKYIDEAVELAISEYKNECDNNNQLVVKDYRDKLKDLIYDIFNSKYGLVAIEEGKLVADIPFIIELKKDETVDKAIKQMKEKEYFQKFIKEHENILAVAICYDSKRKDHSCKIEKINFTEINH